MAVAVKDGRFDRYHNRPGGVRYGAEVVGPPATFEQGRFVEYEGDDAGRVLYGDYGGYVVAMDQNIPASIRFGTGI